MTVFIREMSIQDYEEVLALWDESDGVGLSAADSKEQISRFLHRNPDLSFLAYDQEILVGTILCGHDGRRGYVHHLAVRQSHRRRGIAGQLVDRVLGSLAVIGIDKCHLFVFRDNAPAIKFWLNMGWILREDLSMCSHYTDAHSLVKLE